MRKKVYLFFKMKFFFRNVIGRIVSRTGWSLNNDSVLTTQAGEFGAHTHYVTLEIKVFFEFFF